MGASCVSTVRGDRERFMVAGPSRHGARAPL